MIEKITPEKQSEENKLERLKRFIRVLTTSLFLMIPQMGSAETLKPKTETLQPKNKLEETVKIEEMRKRASQIDNLIKQNPDQSGDETINGQLTKSFEKRVFGDLVVQTNEQGIFFHLDLSDQEIYYLDVNKDGVLDGFTQVMGKAKEADDFLIYKELMSSDPKFLEMSLEGGPESIKPDKWKRPADKRKVMLFDHSKKRVYLADFDKTEFKEIEDPIKVQEKFRQSQDMYDRLLKETLDGLENNKK